MNRELDKEIAEKIFGHEVVLTKTKRHEYYTIGKPDWYDEYGEMKLVNPLPNYSSDISNAWEVVEKFRDQGLQFELRVSPGTLWIVWVARLSMIPFQEDELLAEAKGESAPLAICLAALKTVDKLGK